MAESSLDLFLMNLKRLLVYNADLFVGVLGEAESLYNEFSLLRAFLSDSAETAKIGSENLAKKELRRQIRGVLFEAEDVIDTLVVEATNQRARKSVLLKGFSLIFNFGLRHHSLSKNIESIRKKLKEIYNDNNKVHFEVVQLVGKSSSSSRYSSENRVPVMEEEDIVVGFDKEAQTIIERLTGETKRLEVISVVGMGGIGKTTLARKIYTCPFIRYHFHIQAWVYVSQEYKRREVFLSILGSVTNLIKEEMYNWSDNMLAESLYKHLRSARYLIVMDDVWGNEAWDDLRLAFPNSNNGSRILLTSRDVRVALHSNPYYPPHYLRFLTEDESWELFCRKAFQEAGCPLDLEEIGRQIVWNCGGLPLAIVVIAGILRGKEKTRQSWMTMAENVRSHEPETLVNVLELSYKQLPFFLKACFLYFGAFPVGFEIPVWKLLRLWVAEGFTEQRGQACSEDTAEDYLEDLVNRNLIIVTKRRYNGQIKACRVHEALRELCLREAAEEQFLREIRGYVNVQSFLSTQAANSRRISIHSHVLNYIASKPSDPLVRSFLCFALENTDLHREHVSFIPKAFKLLRVLDIMPMSFPCFPIEIAKLANLRYAALSGDFDVIPESISSLWNLQTLIVETTSRNLDILADIWKMLEFRHLHTNVSAHLHKPHSKAQKHNEDHVLGRNIQTLSMVSPDSCSENILVRTPYLKKLGIRGKLLTLVEENKGSSLFDNLAKLDRLEALKLFNDIFPHSLFESKLPSLPPCYKFPPNLRKLTLLDTLLDWQHMYTLAMLPKLEVLKLKENAFKGQLWEPLDGGFRLLKVLQLGRTDLVRWEASSHHFPRLECLVLKHCESLEAIPSGLGDVPTLQNIELHFTSSSAVASARLIQQELQSMGVEEFKLLVYPPDLELVGTKDATSQEGPSVSSASSKQI